MTLFEKTRDLLKHRPITLTFAKIEEKTAIKQAWLSMFASGKIKNPSVNTIQKLYEHLTNEKLDI